MDFQNLILSKNSQNECYSGYSERDIKQVVCSYIEYNGSNTDVSTDGQIETAFENMEENLDYPSNVQKATEIPSYSLNIEENTEEYPIEVRVTLDNPVTKYSSLPFNSETEIFREPSIIKYVQDGEIEDPLNFEQFEEKVHATYESYECNICRERFLLQDHLNSHMVIHTGNLTPVLVNDNSISDPTISEKPNPKHLKTSPGRGRTGERRHECGVCGKYFRNGPVLKRHTLSHSGDKPFECHICSKTFTRSDNLKAHAFLHSGKRPFSCDLCGKSFPRLGALTRHALTHKI